MLCGAIPVTNNAACLTTMCAVDLDVNWRNVDGKKVYCLHVVLLSVKRYVFASIAQLCFMCFAMRI